MLSYPLDEAVELLSTKLDGAKKKLEECTEDGEFLREQITVGRTCFWFKRNGKLG